MPDRAALSGLRRLGRLPVPGLRPAAGARPEGRGRPKRTALLGSGRFELAVVAILKNETAYLEEWLCHHLAVGAAHFFLYDNGSEDDLHGLLRPYVNHGLVTLTYFPLRGGQRDANNHALRWYGDLAEWLAFVDIDEFLVPHGDTTVPAILAGFPEASQVLVARREFCFSGHRERPEGFVTEAFRMASEGVPRVGGSNVLGKPIVRSARITRMGIHAATTVDGATVDVTGHPVPEARPLAAPVYAPLQVNHYYTKSWAEFEAKRSRTSTSTHAFPLPAVPFDIPAERDSAIDPWIARTRERLAEMRALAPSPYRFGSRLDLEGFPRNDQLSVQAAAVVSNELAGLAQPQKQRSFDVPRPVEGRGAVGRAGAAAAGARYEPAPGRFLASVHVRQQLAWLDATTEWAVGEEWPAMLTVEGSSPERDSPGEPWSLRPAAAGGVIALEGRLATDGLRCHALLFTLAVKAPMRIEVSLRARAEGAAWVPAVAADLDTPGTWLGLLALDEDPQDTGAVRITLPGAVDVLDLAVATFG